MLAKTPLDYTIEVCIVPQAVVGKHQPSLHDRVCSLWRPPPMVSIQHVANRSDSRSVAVAIIQALQEAKAVVDDSTVTSHIKRIRRKFHDIDDSFDAIESVYGAGYRWKASAA